MNELTKYEEQAQDRSPAAMMMIAIEKGLDLDKVAQAMQLQKEWDELQAKKEFFKAVASFKRENITIPKDKINKQFGSKYTSLGLLLETVNPFLGKHGLSVSFDTKQSDKLLIVKAILRHELGHTDSVELSAPPDTSGGNSKNPIQQIKSTFTYLRSATFEAVTGLAGTEASESDDDGNSSGVKMITQDQVTEITDMLNEVYGENHAKWLEWMKVESVDKIKATDYKKAINALNVAKSKKDITR